MSEEADVAVAEATAVSEALDVGDGFQEAAQELSDAMGGEAAGEGPISVDELGDLGSKLVTMKVNGEEVTLTMAEALKGTQRIKAATHKEMEAARSVKQAKAEIEALLQDPGAFAKRGGAEAVERTIAGWVNSPDLHVQEAVERALARAVSEAQQEAQMTPQQKQHRERERQLVARERAAQEFEESRRHEAHTAEVTKNQQQYTAEFTAALESRGVKATPYNIARAAMAMKGALDNGVEMTADEAVAMAHEEREADFSGELSSLEGDALLARLGPKVAKAVSKALLAKVKGAPPKATRGQAVPRDGEEERITTDAIRARSGMRRSVF